MRPSTIPAQNIAFSAVLAFMITLATERHRLLMGALTLLLAIVWVVLRAKQLPVVKVSAPAVAVVLLFIPCLLIVQLLVGTGRTWVDIAFVFGFVALALAAFGISQRSLRAGDPTRKNAV